MLTVQKVIRRRDEKLTTQQPEQKYHKNRSTNPAPSQATAFNCRKCDRDCNARVELFSPTRRYFFILTRLPSQTISSRWQVDKEAIGLSRVQQFYRLCVARPYHISINSIFKHIHTTSINTIIWQFVPFIYHPL